MDSRHSSRDTNICLWEDVVVQKGPGFRCALNSGNNLTGDFKVNTSMNLEGIDNISGCHGLPVGDGVTDDIVGFLVDQTGESILRSKCPPLLIQC